MITLLSFCLLSFCLLLTRALPPTEGGSVGDWELRLSAVRSSQPGAQLLLGLLTSSGEICTRSPVSGHAPGREVRARAAAGLPVESLSAARLPAGSVEPKPRGHSRDLGARVAAQVGSLTGSPAWSRDLAAARLGNLEPGFLVNLMAPAPGEP